jgi:hypothetical protein
MRHRTAPAAAAAAAAELSAESVAALLLAQHRSLLQPLLALVVQRAC